MIKSYSLKAFIKNVQKADVNGNVGSERPRRTCIPIGRFLRKFRFLVLATGVGVRPNINMGEARGVCNVGIVTGDIL